MLYARLYYVDVFNAWTSRTRKCIRGGQPKEAQLVVSALMLFCVYVLYARLRSVDVLNNIDEHDKQDEEVHSRRGNEIEAQLSAHTALGVYVLQNVYCMCCMCCMCVLQLCTVCATILMSANVTRNKRKRIERGNLEEAQ